MKRIEVKLSLPVVAPLLDVVKQLSAGLQQDLAAPLAMGDLDPEFRDAWRSELLAAQGEDVRALLAMFDDEFFREGMIAFDASNAEPVVRACAAVRLHLRAKCLGSLGDDALESSDLDIDEMPEPVKKAFMCYLFLATIQELIIQHLDESIIES
jgi:hypothetical protein